MFFRVRERAGGQSALQVGASTKGEGRACSHLIGCKLSISFCKRIYRFLPALPASVTVTFVPYYTTITSKSEANLCYMYSNTSHVGLSMTCVDRPPTIVTCSIPSACPTPLRSPDSTRCTGYVVVLPYSSRHSSLSMPISIVSWYLPLCHAASLVLPSSTNPRR